MARKKPNVRINAGALIIVEVNGVDKQYRCSGSNEVTGDTPEKVIKKLQDCLRSSIKSATKK